MVESRALIEDIRFVIKQNAVVIYLFLSLLLVVLDKQGVSLLKKVRYEVIDKVFAVTKYQNQVVSVIRGYYELFEEYLNIKDAHNNLKKEKELLENYVLMTKHLEQENKALRKLMNVIPEHKISYRTTQVLGDISSSFASSLMVTGGEKEGVKKGQFVINQEGLVGRVIEVTEKNSRLMLINDPNSHIPIITEKSRERAIVTGTNNSKILKLKYMPDDTKIELGEFIFTSGDGKLFPPGLLIGVVSLIKNGEYYVQPAVNFSKLDYVILVNY